MIFILLLLSSTVMFFLHWMLNILRYEKIFCEINERIASLTPFSLLCSIFFLSRKLCFLRSPCLLLITESISLDTSGKPTVGFFLKITSPSWIILSISLDELNLIDCWRADDEFSRNNFYFIAVKNFYMAKIIRGILENLTDCFLNIIVNVNFFGDSKFQYYWALPWNTATSKP